MIIRVCIGGSKISTQPKVGLGYRRSIREELFEAAEKIDCVEVLVEHFMPLSKSRILELEALSEEFTVVLHGVSLSLGSATLQVMDGYWDNLTTIARITGATYLGEHISVSRGGGFDLGHLSPVWRSQSSQQLLIQNIRQFRDRTGLQLALENITEQVSFGQTITTPYEFMAEVCVESGALVLLDVANLEINRNNRIPGHSTTDALFILNRARWVEVHIAGGSVDDDGFLIDSHSTPVADSTLSILASALSLQRPEAVVVERDSDFDDFEALLQDLEKVRGVVSSLTSERDTGCT